jgi:CHAD domain-containing protein
LVHRIGRHEAIGDALWRLLVEDVAGAREALSHDDASGEERVHRARQRLKRARSLLLVLKPLIGGAAADHREALADAARLLAGARDADAAAASARGLRALVPVGDTGSLDRIVADLDRKAEEAHRDRIQLETVIARLADVEQALVRDARGENGARLFERALERFYADGRKSMKRARVSLSTPDLHRWRKDVKNLWHLIRLGRKRLPRAATMTADELERLGDLLGRDHDHAVLAEKLALSPHADHGLMGQLAIIARKRHALESDALKLGARVYSTKPKKFAGRMRLD